MSISRSKTPLHYRYTLNGHILEQVKDNPYLGITISDDLKWSTHINKIANRGSSILGFIRRNLKYCSMSLRETAYISLVRSILEYSAVVWDPHLKKDSDKLEAIQRRAARFVHNDYSKYSSVTQMLKDLKWQPLADRRRDSALFYYTSRLLEISPEYFGHSVSFIGPKNEMYCDVLSDRLIFYRKIR